MAKLGPGSLDPRVLARKLRLARRDAGLSKRELAARLGLDRAAIRKIEEGRDARCSTLQRYVGRLAGLSPPELLDADEGRPPPALPAAWKRARRLQGLSAGRLVLRLEVDEHGAALVTATWSDLRVPGAAQPDPRELLQRVFEGPSAELARALSERDDPDGLSMTDEHGVHHSFRADAESGWTYVRRMELPADPTRLEDSREAVRLEEEGCSVELRLPVRRLRLELHRPEDAEPVLLQAAARHAAVGTSSTELARRLHGWREVPEGRSRAGRALVELRHPLPGLRYGLAWRSRSPTGRAEAPAKDLSAASALSRARRRSGSSARAQARLMGCSPQTVTAAEQGRDPRWSTLQAALLALPELSSWELLPIEDDALFDDPELHWRYQCDLAGCVAEELHKEVTVQRSGGLTMAIHTDRLEWRHRREDDALLWLGFTRQVLQSQTGQLRELEASEGADERGLRIRRLESMGRAPQHLLRVPAAATGEPVSFTRRLVNPGAFVMTAEKARELTGQQGPFHVGTSFAAQVPCRRLRLTVRLPARYRPVDVRAHAWDGTEPPDPERADRLELLHPDGLEVQRGEGGRSLELSVDRPPTGFMYGLSWQLPGAPALRRL